MTLFIKFLDFAFGEYKGVLWLLSPCWQPQGVRQMGPGENPSKPLQAALWALSDCCVTWAEPGGASSVGRFHDIGVQVHTPLAHSVASMGKAKALLSSLESGAGTKGAPGMPTAKPLSSPIPFCKGSQHQGTQPAPSISRSTEASAFPAPPGAGLL